MPMTTLAVVALSLFVVASLFAIVRRATRVPANAELKRMTLSRHWLTQHQSDDRA